MNKKKLNQIKLIISVLFLIIMMILSYYQIDIIKLLEGNTIENIEYQLDSIPEYNGKDHIIINHNEPVFSEEDLQVKGEKYSNLDSLGRCGTAIAKVGINTMPTEKRGSIGMIKPTGWHTVKYDIVNGKYLYNRCHLIGYQLTGENANEKNLITCTRYTNTIGMLQFENQVAEYVKKTNNHVLYKVTPVFDGQNLLASGIQIQAKSIEDHGKSIKFNVYIFNIQEGIKIDYKTGNSKLIK